MERKEERKKLALEYIKRNCKCHWEESYGPDCRVYHDRIDSVTLTEAETAIEIALGEYDWKPDN